MDAVILERRNGKCRQKPENAYATFGIKKKKKSFGGWAWGVWSVPEGDEIRKLNKIRP